MGTFHGERQEVKTQGNSGVGVREVVPLLVVEVELLLAEGVQVSKVSI